MRKSKVLAVVQPKTREMEIVGRSPADIIVMAVQGKADLGKVREFLDLQKEFEANEARKAFAKSFARAQADIQPAVKKSTNPQTHSKYAKLEGVIEASQPVYTKSGFSVIFYEEDSPKPDHIRVCADVLHELGHQRTYHYDAPLETTGLRGNENMTKTHGKASAVAYARRYLLCMIWNIPTIDEDGNSASGKPIVQPSTSTHRPPAQDASIVPNPDNECHGCGTITSDAAREYSKKRFGKCLCIKCQKTAKPAGAQ